jgi:hypothetical protein
MSQSILDYQRLGTLLLQVILIKFDNNLPGKLLCEINIEGVCEKELDDDDDDDVPRGSLNE